jgi:hypothetical protein
MWFTSPQFIGHVMFMTKKTVKHFTTSHLLNRLATLPFLYLAARMPMTVCEPERKKQQDGPEGAS